MDKSLRATEQSIDSSFGIDTWGSVKILNALIAGQERAIIAVKTAIPQIEKAANALSARLAMGGRLAYAGAGTSIRIAVQDGSELPATFGVAEDKIIYLIAGGRAAIFETLADAEDDAEAGKSDTEQLNAADTLVAIAASGRTPYTVAAAKAAKAKGVFVISVVNNPDTPLGASGDVEIVLNSGPEVIAGSTRMGAGTAQKAALNMLSTLVHIRLGAVHDGMMVNVQAGNAKLQHRAAEMIAKISGAPLEEASQALHRSGSVVKPAVLLCAGAADLASAQILLEKTKGNLRLALAQLKHPQT
ncbi:MAG: N-acetylmuramic acid 6-phosphate etherase [Aestuariivirga sp.]